jgi:phosphoglycerate dehydrogenase-like enzyme
MKVSMLMERSDMKILIPDSIALTFPASAVDSYHVYDVTAPFDLAHADAQMLVLWGNSATNLHSAVTDLPNLQLVQTLAAGPDAALAAGFAPHITICSGRSLHDGPVAEHALAMLLYVVRGLDQFVAAQQQQHWDTRIGKDQTVPATQGLYTLAGATVVILGYGSIAAALTPLLQGLGATVIGVATSAGERYGHPVSAMTDVQQVLPQADVVLSLLPALPSTERLVDGAFLAHLKPSAVFVNVGRGKTVDEDALVAALKTGRLRAAALDVTYVEPLPAASPLWDCPNLLLTPHVAGGRPQGAVALVQAQVDAVRAGKPARNVVR